MPLLWNYILLTEDPEIRSKIFAEAEKISNFEKFFESEFLEKFLDRAPVNSPDTKLKN